MALCPGTGGMGSPFSHQVNQCFEATQLTESIYLSTGSIKHKTV